MCSIEGLCFKAMTRRILNVDVHPLHFDSDSVNGLSPLQAETAWAALSSVSLSGDAGFQFAVDRKLAAMKAGQVGLRRIENLVVAINSTALTVSEVDGGSTMVLLEIPLLFAEIDFGFDPGNGQPVIVLTDPFYGGSLKNAAGKAMNTMSKKETAGNTWLFQVKGDEGDVKKVLVAMGSIGAIGFDFCKEHKVDPQPLGEAGSRVHAVTLKEVEADGEADEEAITVAKTCPMPSTLSGCASGLVMKVVTSSSLLAASSEEQVAVRREVSMLVAAQGHPNVVRFYGLFHFGHDEDNGDADNRCGIVMENCGGGDLFDKIMRAQISEEDARDIASGILGALHHLHSARIVHRHVKPENVLLAPCGRPVLIHFGIACRESDRAELTKRCGSPGYVAPEVLLGLQSLIGPKIDLFSFGVLMHCVFCAKALFSCSTLASTCKKTVRCQVDLSEPAFETVSSSSKEFLRKLLAKHPRDRPSAGQALVHSWIKGDTGGECLIPSMDVDVGPRYTRRARAGSSSPAPYDADEAARRLMFRTKQNVALERDASAAPYGQAAAKALKLDSLAPGSDGQSPRWESACSTLSGISASSRSSEKACLEGVDEKLLVGAFLPPTVATSSCLPSGRSATSSSLRGSLSQEPGSAEALESEIRENRLCKLRAHHVVLILEKKLAAEKEDFARAGALKQEADGLLKEIQALEYQAAAPEEPAAEPAGSERIPAAPPGTPTGRPRKCSTDASRRA